MSPDSLTDWIIAIATVFGSIATIAVAILAPAQLRGLKKQIALAESSRKEERDSERKWRTIEECHRYNKDTLLIDAMRDIRLRSKNGSDYSCFEDRDPSVTHLLNYLESVALGVRQRVYEEAIVCDLLRPSIEVAVEIFILGCTERKTEGRKWVRVAETQDNNYFPQILALYHKWNPNPSPPTVLYEDGNGREKMEKIGSEWN